MGSGSHHIVPLKVFVRVLVALLILTFLTVAASRVDFGAANALVAILIATVKAGLVMAFFMHLKYDDKLYMLVFFLGLFFLVIMFFFSQLDIVTRVLQHSTL
jgi:cytochrome c oxidase subunit 4